MKVFLGSPTYHKGFWTLHEGFRITNLSSAQAEVLKLVGFPLLSDDGQDILENGPIDWQGLWEILNIIDVGFTPYILETLHRVEDSQKAHPVENQDAEG